MAQHSGRRCVVLVNSTYNLSYLPPFCSSSPHPPPSRPNPLCCLSPTLSLSRTFHFFHIIHTHSRALVYFTFLRRPFSSSFFFFFFCLGFTYLQVFFSWSCIAPLKKHNISLSLYIFMYIYISFSLSLTRSLTLSFSLSLPRNF